MSIFKKDGWTIYTEIDSRLTGKTHAFEIDSYNNNDKNIIFGLARMLTGNEFKLVIALLARCQERNDETKNRYLYVWSKKEIRKISGLSKSQYETALIGLKKKKIVIEEENRNKYIVRIPEFEIEEEEEEDIDIDDFI